MSDAKARNKNAWGFILRLFGWKVNITVPWRKKCIICVAPHTSNYDFLIGLAAYRSLGRKANFLMKEGWFFFPLKYIFRALGGIPVPGDKGSRLTEKIIERFDTTDYMNLAVTPEGTRSLTSRWRRGFLYIAYGAKVPVQLGVIDFKRKEVVIADEYHPTGSIEEDMKAISAYYSHYGDAARYPEKFTTDDSTVATSTHAGK